MQNEKWQHLEPSEYSLRQIGKPNCMQTLPIVVLCVISARKMRNSTHLSNLPRNHIQRKLLEWALLFMCSLWPCRWQRGRELFIGGAAAKRSGAFARPIDAFTGFQRGRTDVRRAGLIAKVAAATKAIIAGRSF